MPTAFCSLQDAYGDNWNSPTAIKPQHQAAHIIENSAHEVKSEEKPHLENPNNEKSEDKYDFGGDIKSFCPNCSTCLKTNDSLQQKIIDQNIWPRPRWVPQYPHAYVPKDPYNRYWMDFPQASGREDFSMYDRSDNIDVLLKVIIFILVILVIINLIDVFSTKEVSKS